ncbi:WD repeat-containing protein 74-like [Homarus americanus]|uniref:WD repeat-containing protein 74-like n=1 Tax=Homarus americanus TaxID=6706 RepID=UPI001C474D0B|nr:WD repeat-containing protein 74-like [Homarus americanus]
MRQNPGTPSLIATGGKENDLQLWDLQHPEEPTFKAKNVKPDMLELRVPVWVTDAAFLEDQRTLAVSSRHKHVRVFEHSLRIMVIQKQTIHTLMHHISFTFLN